LKSEKEIRKWVKKLYRAYEACSDKDRSWEEYVVERTKIETEIETLNNILSDDKGSFEAPTMDEEDEEFYFHYNKEDEEYYSLYKPSEWSRINKGK